MLGALQREHLRALFASDHHRINLAGADGAERFLGFGQADTEFLEFAGLCRAEVASATQAGRRGAGQALAAGSFHGWVLPFVTKSNPTIRRVVLARLPMSRRTGSGNSLT